VEVVRETGGIHAQVQASAELQLAARVEGITQEDVRNALWRDRNLVKTWTLRGTLHLHPADEVATWFAARRAVAGVRQELPEWRDPAGVLHPAVGHDELRAARAAVLEALDGRILTRDELAAQVGHPRLLSGFAFLLDELCQGPPQGNRVTLVRPDQWVENWQPVDEQDALREVCRRYIRTYGPVRPGDFREWFASQELKPADARALFESLADELEAVEVEGHEAYMLAGDSTFAEAGTLRLLPEYDVYVMGFREREHLVPEPVREQVAAHGRGKYEGPAGVRFLVADGVTTGLWERKKRGKRIELSVTPVRKLTRAARSALDGEAERIGAFFGLDPVLTLE
jgi:DNA glycosylase AlkZ-like